MLVLRPYQGVLKNGARDEFLKGHRAVLLVAPTGGGKTVIYCDMGAETAMRGKRVLVLVHRRELIRQAMKKFAWTGAHIGVIARGFKRDLSAPIQIASVGTLVNRMQKIPYKFDLIIIDEAHHAPAGQWDKIIKYYSPAMVNGEGEYKGARVLGLSATPLRTDGGGLDHIFDSMFVGPQYSELADDGYLVRPLVFGSARKIDLTRIHMRMGDYVAEDTAREFNKPEITGDAVKFYKEHFNGKPCVIYCCSVKHSQDVANDFKAANITAMAVNGDIDDELREKVLGDTGMLVTGELQVVTCCSLIDEGVDVPLIFGVIHLCPTQSLVKWLQRNGRASRPVYAPGFDLETREGRLAAIAASDKPHAIIGDLAGNCFINGMPDDIREWSLVGFKERKQRGAKAKAKEANVRQCGKCYNTHKWAASCPRCGNVYPVIARNVDQVEGELEPIQSEELKKFIALNARHEVQKLRTLDELKEYGIKKGYKPGWALHIHASRNKKQTGV